MAGNDILSGIRTFKKDTNLIKANDLQSTFRNESLERILGKEKAVTLFGQLEKINSMDNVKMNRNNQSQSIQQYSTGRFSKHQHISGRPMNTQPCYEEDE